jgi:hypothetical protein
MTKTKQNFTSKITYSVFKEFNEDTKKVKQRYFELTITTVNEELAEKLWNDCYEYLSKNINFNIGWVGCPTREELLNGKFSYYDSISIYDKEEYEELKEIYKEWKKGIK